MTYSVTQLSSCRSALNERFVIFQTLKDNSGYGWDDLLQVPTAPQEVWNAYIEAHPEAAQFKKKTLPFYRDLCYGLIVIGILYTC
jgi:hypothetical protein